LYMCTYTNIHIKKNEFHTKQCSELITIVDLISKATPTDLPPLEAWRPSCRSFVP